MDKGGVNDLESVVKCVQRAIDQAELMADCQISSVYLALLVSTSAARMKLVWCLFRLLYTTDAAHDLRCVALGVRRLFNK